MSYILNALKRAESERGGKALAGPLEAGADAERRSRRGRFWLWLTVSLITANVLTVGTILWLNYAAPPPRPASASTTVPAAVPAQATAPSQATAPAPAAAPVPRPVTPRPMPAPRASANTRPLQAEVGAAEAAADTDDGTVPLASAAAPTPKRVAPSTTPSAKPIREIGGGDTDDTSDASEETADATPTVPPDVQALLEQAGAPPAVATRPENDGADLPTVTGEELGLELNVLIYSTVPKQRFVVINQQKYREGQQLENGRGRLEQITREGILLNLGDRRVRILIDQ